MARIEEKIAEIADAPLRQAIAEEFAKLKDVVGWLRNIEQKPWALAMPYELGGEVRPMYPDFLVVRKENGGLVVDILEPHSPSLSDSYAKAKGLAQFAAKHAMQFGRVELIRLAGSEIKRLDLVFGVAT